MDKRATAGLAEIASRGSQESVADVAYRRLKRALTRGHVSPGTVLTTRNLARQFGTSIAPVREALIRLQAQGALALSSNGSAQVPLQSVEEFREITNLRKALEGSAAAAAALKATPKEVGRIAKLDDRFARALRHNDVTGVLDANEEFHFAIYLAAGNATLLRHIELLWLRSGPYIAALYRFFALTNKLTDSDPDARFGHKQIIQALQKRDTAAASEGISHDVDFTLSQLVAVAGRASRLRSEHAVELFRNGWIVP